MNKLYTYLILLSNCSNRTLLQMFQYLQATGELTPNVKDSLKFSKDDTQVTFFIDDDFPSYLTIREYNTILFILTELIPQYATMHNMDFFVTIFKDIFNITIQMNIPNDYPEFKKLNKQTFIERFNKVIHVCK